MAWAWKINYKWKVVLFSNDFPAEVNNKLGEYKDMKKILKEKQVHCHTPYSAKIRIYRENRPCIYKVQQRYLMIWEVEATPYTSDCKSWSLTGNRGLVDESGRGSEMSIDNRCEFYIIMHHKVSFT